MVRHRDTASAPCQLWGLLLDTCPSLLSPSMEKWQSDREILVEWDFGIVFPITAFVCGVRHIVHLEMMKGAESIPPQVRGE